jgi:hypothetical protein
MLVCNICLFEFRWFVSEIMSSPIKLYVVEERISVADLKRIDEVFHAHSTSSNKHRRSESL